MLVLYNLMPNGQSLSAYLVEGRYVSRMSADET